MKRSILVNSISFFFIVLFVYTGVEKLMDIHSFKEQLISSPLLSSISGLIAWGLPATEIILAIMLFVPVWQLKGLYATLTVMTLFTIYVLVILFMDNHLSCNCGGIIEELSPQQHVLFNTTCVVISLVGILVARRPQPTSRFKWLTNTSALFLFLFIGWTLFTAFSRPATVKTGLEGRLLPSFTLLLTDSVTHLNTADIPTGKPIILIGFSPFCRHCQEETSEIMAHIQQFRDMQIYFITPYPFKDMKIFYRYFKMAKYPNIIMGRDTSDYFLPYLKVRGVPNTAIYDSKKRLKQVMQGRADVTKLIAAASEL